MVGLDDAIEANTAYSVSITVTDVSKRELDLEKRIRYECDDADEKRVIENASGNANYLAKSAAEYTLRIGRSYDPIYKRYFGSGSRQKVFDNFRVIEDVRFSDKFTVDCPGWSVCHGNGPIFIEDRKIHFCSGFFDLHPIEALCGTPTDLGSNRAVFTFVAFASLPDFQFSATVSGRGCDYAAGLPQETQVLNIDNYLVSTQTPHGASGAHVLTWGHGFCSASLSMSSDPSRVNVYIFFAPAEIDFRAASTIINCTLSLPAILCGRGLCVQKNI